MRSFSPSTTFTCTRTVSPILKLGSDFFVKDLCTRSNRFMQLLLLPTSNRRAPHTFTGKFIQQLLIFEAQNPILQEVRSSLIGASQRFLPTPQTNRLVMPGE